VYALQGRAAETYRCDCCPWFAFSSAAVQAVFPEGTPGTAIDTLARLPLWRDGLNYRHGTGEQTWLLLL
jgi:hypothetical protein